MRRRHAPKTLRKKADPKSINWKKVDWTKTRAQLQQELNISRDMLRAIARKLGIRSPHDFSSKSKS